MIAMIEVFQILLLKQNHWKISEFLLKLKMEKKKDGAQNIQEKKDACGKLNVEFKQGRAINSISPDWQIELVIPSPHLSSAALQ